MQIKDWLKQNVTADARALAWFENDESEPRIVKAYKELLQGYTQDPSTILKTTRPIRQGEKAALVRIEHINFYSICAHHFLPFFGTVDIEYLPGEKILGLGKFPRLVRVYASRFQIQEDLVKEIAEEIIESGRAKAVRVFARARHLCMCSRGPSDNTVETVTEYATGDFGR